MKKSLILSFSLLAAVLVCGAPVKKKFIECSWSNPRTDYLRKNIAHIEKTTPYQGIRIHLQGTGEGKGISVRNIFSKKPWKYEWFKKDVENLKNTKFVQFTDNFLATGVMPGDVEWFSDSDWASVTNNFNIVAKIAKETGMKGIVFDPEEYSAHLWKRINTRNRTLAEIAVKARQRGQEWGKAIFKEFPDIVIFCYFWSSYAKSSPVFRGFMNGVYDVIPPTAKIVDGHESRGYTASSLADLHRGVYEIKKAVSLVEKENQGKYLTQTGFAPAIYLECIIPRREGFIWNRIIRLGSEQYSMSEFLRRHLENCIEVSDEYVWTWSEYRSWFGGKVDGWTPKTWENWLPGITDIFRSVHSPVEYAEKIIARTGSKNLLRNPHFTPNAKQFPDKWGVWQGKNSKGKIIVKKINGKNAAVFNNAGNTNLSQLVPLKPDKRYLLVVKGKVTRDTVSPAVKLSAGFTWRFSNSGGDWFIGRSVSVEIPATGKIETVKKLVTVPKEAPFLFFNLSCSNQNGADDNVYVESCNLFPVPDLTDSPLRLKPAPKAVKKTVKKASGTPGSMPELLKVPSGLKRTGVNLLKNPDFTAKNPGPNHRPWAFSGKKFGYFPDGKGGNRGSVENGYVFQMVPATPGNCYEVTALVKSDRPVTMAVKWGNEKKRWTALALHYQVNMIPQENGVCKAVVQVKAPAKTAAIAVLISGKGKINLEKAEIFQIK